MLKYLILFGALFYLAFAVFLYLFAERFIFLPPLANYKDDSSIIKLITRTGIIISAVYLPNPQATYTILVSHGNAEDLGSIMPLLSGFQHNGFAVFAYDYAGYGTSTGAPSEMQAYADVDAVYDYLNNKLNVSPDHIILYGRSLGAAMAVDLAARKPVAGLILEAPFVTAYRVLTFIPIFPFDQFTNFQKIKKIQCPVLVIHGTRDLIVPFWHGKKLYTVINTPKSFYEVKGAGHNNIIYVAGEDYWDTIKKFAASLDKANF